MGANLEHILGIFSGFATYFLSSQGSFAANRDRCDVALSVTFLLMHLLRGGMTRSLLIVCAGEILYLLYNSAWQISKTSS